MASTPGTVVASGLSPGNVLNTHETHRAQFGKGGHRTVADIVERDAITDLRREEGMTVYVLSNSTQYRLVGGITNSDWVLDTGGTPSTVGIDKFTLSALNISNKFVNLTTAPTDPTSVILTVIGGLEQQYGIDFVMTGNNGGKELSWSGLGLESYLQINDKFSVIYK